MLQSWGQGREKQVPGQWSGEETLRQKFDSSLFGTSATLRCQTAWSFICVQSVRGIARASLVPPLRSGHQPGICG